MSFSFDQAETKHCESNKVSKITTNKRNQSELEPRSLSPKARSPALPYFVNYRSVVLGNEGHDNFKETRELFGIT